MIEGTHDYDWVLRRLTPHPLQSYRTPLVLKNPVGNNLPRTFVSCAQPFNPVINASRDKIRGMPGWNFIEVAGPHHFLITQPDRFTEILLSV